ncbi:MAG: aldolase/citrate lyase family protein [Proteobacteria bacterium]|nr:aldolase/citrate lyase family protein [Pseudomonadota bacterium]
MADLPRLNGVIGALENGGHSFTSFASMDIQTALAMAGSKFDGIVFEGEHAPWDILALRDSMQFMLSRAQIAKSGSLAPPVVPLCRIPVNGVEQGQWHAKQALDTGVYGIVWPHISTVEEAYNAVAACRYPRLSDKPLYEPQGIRGDGPGRAARYWGLSQQEYYSVADVWPLAPHGEILVIIQIEDQAGIKNLPDMLKNVPGIGAVLIGEGDMGQELGFPRDYEHPALLECMAQVVATCKEHDVVVGHPHANAGNMQRLVDEGYRFLMTGAGRTYAGLEKGLDLTGRS